MTLGRDTEIDEILSACGLADCTRSANSRTSAAREERTDRNINRKLKDAVPYILLAGLAVNIYIAWRVSK